MKFISKYLIISSAICCIAAPLSAGGSNRAITDAAQPLPVDISGDASQLLVTNGNGQGLQLVDTNSGRAKLVSPAATAGYGATLSPDGSRVAYKSIAPDGAQSPAIYNSSTGENTILATSALAGTPAISASGVIAFTVENNLIIQSADGATLATYDLGHHVNLVAISDDGSSVAYNDEDDQIVVLNLKNGKRTKVTDDKASYFNPAFSSNGKKVLAQTVSGHIVVTNANRAKVRILGQGDNPEWLDNKTVSFTSKSVEVGVAVNKSEVVAVSTSGKVKGILASADGDAAGIAKGNAIAFSRLAAPAPGRDAASASSLQVGVTSGGNVWMSDLPVQLDATPAAPARSIVDSSTQKYLSGVPYIHQNNDTPDWWNGNWSCNATAAIMAIQYYDILPKHPMTSSWPTPHNSDYGWYIPNQYTFNGHTYNKSSKDPSGTYGKGGYGYITQNGWEDTKGHMAEYISYHGPSSGVDWSPSYAESQTEINNDHPFVILTSLTSAGHYPLCVGYVKNQHTLIFNDPYGNKNSGSYPSNNGVRVRYDWPGYNNGYSNLNTVHCYIWCRASNTPPPPADIIVDNSSGNFSASGNWSTGTSAADKYGSNYRYRSTAAVSDAAVWNFTTTQARNYQIYAWWSQGSNRSASAPYIWPNGTTVNKNQQTGGGAWQSLGTKALSKGAQQVKLSCWTTGGYVVVADAIKVVAR